MRSLRPVQLISINVTLCTSFSFSLQLVATFYEFIENFQVENIRNIQSTTLSIITNNKIPGKTIFYQTHYDQYN